MIARRTTIQSFLSVSLANLKVINYYPSANSWANMWTNWDLGTINSDFARIKSLNGNTVRIILQVGTFGWPAPSQTMTTELSQIIQAANSNGLQVQLTLFDWWSNYSDIPDSETWAAAILSPYQNDPRVAFVELQNEIDPTNATAMTWATTMIPYLRSIVGSTPVTVSGHECRFRCELDAATVEDGPWK